MKKLSLLLFAILFSTLSVFAQQTAGASDGTPLSGSRDNEFICLPNSVFSQTAPTSDNAYYCQVGYLYYMAADDYTTSSPFSTMRFWGADLYGCTLAPSESFDIFIYDGNPTAGGNLIHSFTVNGVVTQIPLTYPWWGISSQVYQIDIDFGLIITQLSGWIAIQRKGSTCDDGFAWSALDNGGNSMSYNGVWVNTGAELFFCLGKGTAPVPISNWAIVLGILLIGTFIVIRFRRTLV